DTVSPGCTIRMQSGLNTSSGTVVVVVVVVEVVVLSSVVSGKVVAVVSMVVGDGSVSLLKGGGVTFVTTGGMAAPSLPPGPIRSLALQPVAHRPALTSPATIRFMKLSILCLTVCQVF